MTKEALGVKPLFQHTRRSAACLQPLCGLPTGIGSVPWRSITSALHEVMRVFPELPAWPQLVQRFPREQLLMQCQAWLGGTSLDAKQSVLRVHSLSQLRNSLEPVTSAPTGRPLTPPRSFAPGLYAFMEQLSRQRPRSLVGVKGQLIGPITLLCALRDGQGRDFLDDVHLRGVIGRLVGRVAIGQVRLLQRVHPRVVLFFDEPVLATQRWRALPAAHSGPLRELLAEVLIAVRHTTGAILGVHCCSAEAWWMFLGSALEILSFDAGSLGALERIPRTRRMRLNRFLRGGGLLSWGVVPCDPRRMPPVAGCVRHTRRLMRSWGRQGIDQELLQTRWLVTPACGTGTLPPPLAHEIHQATRAVARTLRAGWALDEVPSAHL